MFLPFMEDWIPDAPFTEGGQSAVSVGGGPKNVINTGKFLAPFKGFSAITTAAGVGGDALGMFSFKASDGNYYTFAGITAALKLVNGTNWEDVTRVSGGAYATASGDRWNFASYGDRVIAVNFSDATQTYLAGIDTDYSPLAATAPKAKYICASGDFIVLGYVDDGTKYPCRVQWSGQGAPTGVWTPSSTTQADYQDLDSSNGDITGLAGFADYFIVFQERAITRFTYVGSPLIFQRNEIVSGIGCAIPSSIVRKDNAVYFIASDGYKKLMGGAIEPIGLGRVDRTFYGTVDPSEYYHMTATADPIYPVIHWSLGVGSGDVRYLFSYNYLINKWAWVELTISSSAFYNTIGVIYTSANPGGVLAGFTASDNKLGKFTSSNYTASLQTAMLASPKGRADLQRIKLRSDALAATTVSVVYSTIEYPNSSTSTAFTAVGNNNEYTGRASSTGHAVLVTYPPSTSGYMIGAEFTEYYPEGSR